MPAVASTRRRPPPAVASPATVTIFARGRCALARASHASSDSKRLAGTDAHASMRGAASLEARAQPVPRHVEHHRPLTPKCVHSSDREAHRDGPSTPEVSPRHATRRTAARGSRRRRARAAPAPASSRRWRDRGAGRSRSRRRRCRFSAASGRRSRARPRRACSGAASVSSSNRAVDGRSPVTRCPASSVDAGVARSLSSASSTSRERLVSGKSLPSASSCSATPSSRRTRRVSCDRKRAQHAADRARRPPQKSRSVTTRLVTLQREPPLTRILAPMRSGAVEQRTRSAGAAARRRSPSRDPAAPAPTTTTSASRAGNGDTATVNG